MQEALWHCRQGKSWMNTQEVHMAAALAQYLLTVGGLQREQLTILSTPAGIVINNCMKGVKLRTITTILIFCNIRCFQVFSKYEGFGAFDGFIFFTESTNPKDKAS